MNLTEVKKSLDKMFSKQPSAGAVRNIVFWYDEESVFESEIDSLELDNAKIIKLTNNNAFATKLYIEREDKENNLLVYAPIKRPNNKENWLTDTIKYSSTFSTDETSLIMLNYKIDQNLRPVVDKYKAFFRSNERCRKFENYNLGTLTESKIDIGILSVLCKLNAPNFENVIKALLIEYSKQETTLIDTISKFGSEEKLWELIRKNYDYNFPENSFEKLTIMLLVSHLDRSSDMSLPKEWELFSSKNPNCYVFVDNFMKNLAEKDTYNHISNIVSNILNIEEKLSEVSMDDMIDCDTFEFFDNFIINRIRENLTLNIKEFEKYNKFINDRRNRRYYSQYETQYNVIQTACKFLYSCEKNADLTAASTAKLFDKYVNEYYKIDMYYRHFIAAMDSLDSDNEYRLLFEVVENKYTNWYLNELSVKWSSFIDESDNWGISGVVPQQSFFSSYVTKYVRDDQRMIVIISDGLRYESSKELLQILNAEQKGSSELSTMLGVIPSYTKLGMAALLPHKTLEITESADVLADGISTEGTDNREKILKTVKSESVAITYNKLMQMSKTEMNEKFNGMKLIYIYHNCIDARGDNAKTEKEVFDATNKTFKELSSLIKILKNNISAINILITADHGYIYRRTPLVESDKTPKEANNSIETKRRFILTKEDIQLQGTQTFSMGYLQGNSDKKVAIPRGTNCFKIQGAGNNYVHGGSSLQEIVVPVIKFKSDKNNRTSLGAKKVTLGISDISRKITSIICHISFFQNEKTEDKLLPLRAKAYFADEHGNCISTENVIIAESNSIKPEERTYKEKFTLKNLSYDKNKTYYLIIEDEEETVNKQIDKIPFTIDLVFGSNINF